MPNLQPQSISDSEKVPLDLSLKKLALNLAPVTMLVCVLAVCLKLVYTEASEVDSIPPLKTPVAPQAIVIEAKSVLPAETVESGVVESGLVESAPVATQSGADGEVVWRDINDAISNLNELVGVDLFLDLSHTQKGQMEVRLDKGFWDRVKYQTRVDLKTDISDLWHLYATEYNYVDSSVVYFIDDSSGRVIDIFSKTD